MDNILKSFVFGLFFIVMSATNSFGKEYVVAKSFEYTKENDIWYDMENVIPRKELKHINILHRKTYCIVTFTYKDFSTLELKMTRRDVDNLLEQFR